VPVEATPDHEESAVDYAARTEVTLMFLRSLDERL